MHTWRQAERARRRQQAAAAVSGYVKLFGSLLDSTVWQENHATRVVWITLLAMADANGEVHAAVPGLAKRAGVTLEECQAALETFLAPDPYSRTPDREGRRIEPIRGGWLLINHAHYREQLNIEHRRASARARQQRKRAREQSSREGVTGRDESVTVTPSHEKSRQAEAEAAAPAAGAPGPFREPGGAPACLGTLATAAQDLGEADERAKATAAISAQPGVSAIVEALDRLKRLPLSPTERRRPPQSETEAFACKSRNRGEGRR